MAFINPYSLPEQKDVDELPIEIQFNFRPIIDHYKRSDYYMSIPSIKEVVHKIEKEKVIDKSFASLEVVRDQEENIKVLLAPLFPEPLQNNEIKCLVYPFSDNMINPTSRLEKLIEEAGGKENIHFKIEKEGKPYISACILILNWIYGENIEFSAQHSFEFRNKINGETRYFRSLINADFVNIIRTESAPVLTEEDIEMLKNDFDNLALWKEKIPPKSYIFEGFALLTLQDKTRDILQAHLNNLLLESDVLDHPEKVEKLKSLLRAYFNVPDLSVGIIAYDKDNDTVKPMGFGIFQGLIFDEKNKEKSNDIFDDKTLNLLKIELENYICKIQDLKHSRCGFGDLIRENKIGSYGLFPLSDDGELIAVIELMSKEEKKLNKISAKKFDNIKGLLTTAVTRYLQEYDTKIEAIIKAKCTAIHPTVEWKFREKADLYYKNKLQGLRTEMKDIDFPQVYPLYGQIDIKDSSIKRNAAITSDLKAQLISLKDIFEKAIEISSLPYLGQLLFKLETKISELSLGINVGDEISILDFIQKELEVCFDEILELSAEIKRDIQKYQGNLNPTTKAFTRERHEYESSMDKISKTITDMISERQEVAQTMYPHYYEKYKTDGVEHNIYVGQSLVNNRKYHSIYLKNLRLWQLMTTVEIERKLHTERESLPVPMNVCSLILAHSNPITIKFRMDEKKFDVEGAYNIRYEIIKKRIDKSLIQSTKERLTQPGKIAIVYAHSEEGHEYKSYFEYLVAIGYLEPELESHDLSPVQGIRGLKALRASINFETSLEVVPAFSFLEKEVIG